MTPRVLSLLPSNPVKQNSTVLDISPHMADGYSSQQCSISWSKYPNHNLELLEQICLYMATPLLIEIKLTDMFPFQYKKRHCGLKDLEDRGAELIRLIARVMKNINIYASLKCDAIAQLGRDLCRLYAVPFFSNKNATHLPNVNAEDSTSMAYILLKRCQFNPKAHMSPNSLICLREHMKPTYHIRILLDHYWIS